MKPAARGVWSAAAAISWPRGLTSAALCALAALGCSSAPPLAPEKPTQPGVDASAARPRAGSRIERMLRSAEGQGYRMARVTVPIGEIPRAEVPPMLEPRDAEVKREVPGGFRSRDFAFVETHQASWSCPSHRAGRHALCAACMNPKRPRAVRAEGPVSGSAVGGELAYALIDGIRDPIASSGVFGVRTTRVVAKELLPHLVYAFRFTDPQEPGVDLISFVLPPAAQTEVSRSGPLSASAEVRGALTRVTLQVRQGASETIVAYVMSSAAEAWIDQLSPGAPPPPTDALIVGVELSQAGDEPEPHLVVYLERAAVGAEPP